jgi:hypothetical protein
MTAVDKKTASTNLTTEENPGLQTTETKKCRICGAPATGHAGISFFMDTGYGWAIDKVFMCEQHLEDLTSDEIDHLYLKAKQAHLSKIRMKKVNKSPRTQQQKK